MITNDKLLCPTDGIQINETKVRMVAGLVWLVTLIYLLSGWVLLPLLLTIDFAFRGFNRSQYSPLGTIAGWLVKVFGLSYVGTDQAPKRFAARIGLAFGLVITILTLLPVPTLLPAGILFLFAALEAFAGFCAGCYVFTYYTRFLAKSL